MLLASLPFCPRNGSCSGRPASSTAPALPCPGHIGSGGPWPSGTFSDFRRVVYKAAYRQAVKVDYRKRFRCCTGYYESSSSCVRKYLLASQQQQEWAESISAGAQFHSGADFRENSIWGAGARPKHLAVLAAPALRGTPHCQAGGRRVSPAGLTGSLCSPECSSRSWGPDCREHCACANGGSCAPSTGACACPAGYTGPLCQEPCAAGTYGQGCSLDCQCGNSTGCDRETGGCFCSPGYAGLDGWLGVRRGCREECPVGRYGQDCRRACDCANGGRCFHVDGACLCEAGFLGSRCEERKCLPGLHGLSCHLPCLCDTQHTQSCHPLSGECTCRPGWAGLFCNETCPPGYHGAGCQHPCLCLNGGTCSSETGLCTCPAGFLGEHCSSPCPAETYGLNCSHHCTCQNALACSPIDGSCTCKEGWRGPDCALPCPAGTWGSGCNRTCLCANGAACDPADGRCACTPGWAGSRCQEPCPNWFYGLSCGSKCSCQNADGCDPESGQCRCRPGWTGEDELRAVCPAGSLCTKPCSCRNGAACSPKDGSCDCPPGFRGPTCQRLPKLRSGQWEGQAEGPASRQWAPAGREAAEAQRGVQSWAGHVAPRAPQVEERTLPRHSQPAWLHTLPKGLLRRAGPAGSEGKGRGSFRASVGQGALCCPLQEESRAAAVRWGLRGSGLPEDRSSGNKPSSCFPAACQPGRYGKRCSMACTCANHSACHPVDGSCACPPGWRGSDCSQRELDSLATVPAPPAGSPSLGAVAGIVVAAALLLALLVLLLWCRQWQKAKERQHLAVAYAAGRPESAEYAVPGTGQAEQTRGGWLGPHRLGEACELPVSGGGGEGLGHAGAPVARAALLSNEEPLGRSDSSLSSENPYATIKDLPVLLGKPTESSYMEMKSPSRCGTADAEAGLSGEPARGPDAEEAAEGGTHYDSPKNSHIPCHYDVPPTRHYPPSPPCRRQAR
uniref:Platelet endothelial aggregation receptor 1 n=1 Tax=Varanus komodoensis TaxID=61221 RepID=A0A8D2IR73_VARKO